MLKNLDTLLSIPVSDPDEARRGKVLNVMLFGILISAILGFALLGLDLLVEDEFLGAPEAGLILLSSIIFSIGSVIIYFINRYSSKSAGFLFLLLLTIAFSFSDTPEQVANGRTLFVFTIPITIASLILYPAASYIFAFFSSVIIYLLAISSSNLPNIPAIIGFVMLAFVSWLSSRSLEQALSEVRQININLDNTVEMRTKELTASLAREVELAGRNQAVLESIADGVLVVDENYDVIQANLALSRLLGVRVEDLTNSSAHEFAENAPLTEPDRSTLFELLFKPRKDLTSNRIQWGEKTVSISTAEVYSIENLVLGTVAVFRDFTREAEVDRMKSAFVAMVSHELRTPLNAILGYAEMFLELIYGELNEKQTTITKRIITNSRRLLSLINDLLDQAQIEAGKIKIKKETVNLSELMESLVGTMENLISAKGLVFTTDLDPKLPKTIIGDNARLHQILVNLTNNAIKFTKDGSILVHFSLARENQWSISVSDTGQGIPENDLPYIFDSFKRIEEPTSHSQTGTGLGLSIVKQLITYMEGEITVRSTLEIGSTFIVTLPLETQEGAVKIMDDLALIIEDDEDLSAIFTEALESVGYEVETIKDGLLALQRLAGDPPQLILLDMHLPNVPGEDLLTKIKADERYNNTHVVVTTADARLAESFSEVADFTLVKPISFIQLRDLTARLHK